MRTGAAVLVLDHAGWLGAACASRPIWVYVLCAIAACVVLGLWAGVTLASDRRMPKEVPRPPLNPTEIFPVVAVIGVFASVLLTVPALARHRDVLFVKDNILVERGCHMFSEYEDRFDLDLAEIRFIHLKHRKDRDNFLRISQKGKSRPIRLELNRNSGFLGNIAAFAPAQMAEYARVLREQNLPLPEALGRLLQTPSHEETSRDTGGEPPVSSQ